MKIARVFLNPDAQRWVDMPMPPSGLQQVWGWLATEGALVHPNAIVPRAAVHHILALEIEDGVTASFTGFPGGKPN